MKTGTIATCLLVALICPLLLGAVAPILPSTDYFINDQAGIIFTEHKDAILSLARTLEERTDTQLVVLAVNDTGDMTTSEYADAVFDGWGIGGMEQNGILLFVCNNPSEFLVVVGDGLVDDISTQSLMAPLEENVTASLADNISLAVMQSFRTVAQRLYEHAGQQPDEALFVEVEVNAFSILSPTTLIMFAVVIFAASRSMRVTRKYNKKYGNRHKYKRKDFSAKKLDEDKPRSRFRSKEEEIARLKREALEELAEMEQEAALQANKAEDMGDA